jgi:two-component system, NarL family, sensor histidine kinase DesK
MTSVPASSEMVADRPMSDPSAASDQPLAVTTIQTAQLTRLAPRMAMAVLFVVFGGFYVVAFLHILYAAQGVRHVVLSAVYMVALVGLQLAYFSRPKARPHPPLSYLALLAQASLVYLPLLEFGQAWIGQPGFLAGSVLLALPPVLAWPAFAAIAASAATFQAIFTGSLLDVAYTTVTTVNVGLIVFGLTRLATLVGQLHDARTELAQMAVAQERLRFARDLHDLLGYSLSAITLKSELTHRLMLKQPERAQEELSEVLDISRRALADVRSVASGYRELSLDAEAQSVRSVLQAADVDAHMDIRYVQLPVLVSTLLATVLREGVTNMLRHSKAEWCEITVRQERGQVRMTIVNDGVPETPVDVSAGGGSGIQNLSARVASLGGRLSAGMDRDGRFRLQVTAPVSRGAN